MKAKPAAWEPESQNRGCDGSACGEQREPALKHLIQ